MSLTDEQLNRVNKTVARKVERMMSHPPKIASIHKKLRVWGDSRYLPATVSPKNGG